LEVGFGDRIARLWKAVLLVAVGAAGGGAALAVALVPDSRGVIHACYQVSAAGSTVPNPVAGNVRIIDPSAGQTCSGSTPAGGPAREATLDWNATGPQGPPGTPGIPGAPGTPGVQGSTGKTITIANGHTLTIGGQVITVAGGNGLTIASPPVSERGSGIGHVSISGASPFGFDVFAVSLAEASGGGGAGKVGFHDISITKEVDKASPKLYQACASGKHLKKVTIELQKSGKTYLTYDLTDVLVTSVQVAGAGSGGSVPLEHITLNFGKFKQSSKQK
jgi:hypothetical protein